MLMASRTCAKDARAHVESVSRCAGAPRRRARSAAPVMATVVLAILTCQGRATDTKEERPAAIEKSSRVIAVERFIADYTAPSKRLKAALDNIECAYAVDITGPEGVKGSQFAGRFYAKGEAREDVRVPPDMGDGNQSLATVNCWSPKCAFELRRPAMVTDYAVVRFRQPPTKALRDQMTLHMRANVNPFLRATVQMFDVPIDELVGIDEIHKTFTEIEDQGHTYVEGHFSFPDGNTKGVVRFDPTLDYAVVRYFVEMNIADEAPLKATRDGSVTCVRRDDGYVVPKSIRLRSASTGGKVDRALISDVRLSDISIGTVNDAQFTLTAFGLPDVTLARRRGWYPLNRWYFWVLIGVAAGGALYYWRNRKGQARSESAE